jgi:uncharacterized protein YdeI (YjbR/CyaY-like superfamily)
VWLKLAKKGTGIATVSKTKAIDTALCYGWIDGQLDKFDECYWLTRFTPRKAGSKWSRINRDRATALIARGRMRPAGTFEIERAKADGRWNAAYAPQSTATVPDDLRSALGLVPDALRLFDRLDSANRYAILYRIHNAKGPETRAARIEKFVAMLARGETIHPMRVKPNRR